MSHKSLPPISTSNKATSRVTVITVGLLRMPVEANVGKAGRIWMNVLHVPWIPELIQQSFLVLGQLKTIQKHRSMFTIKMFSILSMANHRRYSAVGVNKNETVNSHRRFAYAFIG